MMNRRAVPSRMGLSLLAAFALAGAAACGDDDPAGPGSQVAPELRGMFLGGDVSALTRLEQAGARYRVDGHEATAIGALMERGASGFRLRLFVDPNGEDVVVNDLNYTITMAQRVKNAGARLLLDFHYSDTWADPAKQYTPAAWADLPFEHLEQQVETYTAGVIATMKQAGVLPDIVQIGNEIDSGLLWPLGRIGGAGYEDADDFDRFGRLLKAGIRGVRGATVPSDSVLIVLHYSQGASVGGTRWFFDHVEAEGVDYDMIGLSYYPWWHGTLEQLEANLEATALRYDKDIVVLETAYPWRDDWTPDFARDDWTEWPVTPYGQAAFLRDVLDAVLATPNDRGAGVVWWYPESVRVPGLSVWGGGSLALFGASGEVLDAAEVFGGD